VCTNIVWNPDGVQFKMSASASNPLNIYAPPVDYVLHVCVNKVCSIEIQGEHDGFPCFEFYKQVDFGSFEKIYTHDFRETGDTAAALGGEMDYSFTRSL